MVMRIWKNWNFFTLLMGMHHGAVAMENSLIALQNVKHRILKRIKSMYSNKYMCSHIHHFQKSKTGTTQSVHQLISA